jgi:hypothetical protein
METTATFNISEVDEYGHHFNGAFTVKTVLTRADRFLADQVRREIIGPSPEGHAVPAALQGEAFMLGQLRVRVVKAPEWWTNSRNGLDMEDGRVIGEIFNLALQKEDEYRQSIKKDAEKALEQLKKQE